MDKRHQERFDRIERLTQEIEQEAPSEIREKARELLRLFMEFHREGLSRLVALSGSSVQKLAGDELVSSILMLYDMHPMSLRERVEGALQKVRPVLERHHGNVRLVAEQDGVVRLRLEGSCQGCPSSAQTLRGTVEQAIFEAAPDVLKIEVEGLESAQNELRYSSCHAGGLSG